MSKEVKVLWLSQEECIKAGAMDMKTILKNVLKANRWLGEGKTVETELCHLCWEEHAHAGRRIGIHAALIQSEEMAVASVKGIPSNPENPFKLGMPRSNGIIILYNEETGYPFAVMDDTLISGLRTGASSAMGAKYCANPDAEVMGLIGCGVIQDACIEATSLVMENIAVVKLYDTSRERARAFVDRWRKLAYRFEICNSAKEAIVDSDIVHTCTNVELGNEYIKADWIKKGSFHSAVSIWDYKDEAVLLPGNKYCMDWKFRLKDPKYTFSDLVADGRLREENIIQISDIMNGKATCRKSKDDVVFFVTLGLCITDTTNAYEVYQNAVKKRLGTEVYLWKNPARF